MPCLISILESSYCEKVNSIWDELEAEYGLNGVKITQYPHFTWQIAYDYDLEQLKIIVEDIIKMIKPFTIYTNGLGLFTGLQPVIFIPVIKNIELIELHRKLWDNTEAITLIPSSYYAPDVWIPHITLAHRDVDEFNIGEIMQKLSLQFFNWEIKIDNIALFYEENGKIGQLKYKFEFKDDK